MNNELLAKLIRKVNFDYVQKFDIKRTKELSFVPVNIQSNTFFVAISPESNKTEISEHIKSVLNMKADFIYLTLDSFNEFYGIFSEEFSKKFNSANVKNTAANEDVNPSDAVEKPQNPKTSKPAPAKQEAVQDEDLLIEDGEIELLEGDIELLEDTGSDAVTQDNKLDSTSQTQVQDEEIQPQTNEQSELNEQTEQPRQDSNEPKRKMVLNPVQESAAPAAPVEEGVKEVVEERRIDRVQNPTKKRLGEIFVEEGLITEKQLTIALAESKATEIPLGSMLVKLGFIKINDLKEALSAQQGVELASTEQLKPIPSTISVLPEDFVRLNKVIPLSSNKTSLVVGMVNPGDTSAINEIVYLTGLKPTVLMITHYEFENFVQQFYSTNKSETDKILSQIHKDSIKDETGSSNLWDQVDKEIQDTSGLVSKFANKIVTMGIDLRVSDIHIEPRFTNYVVRYRKDGILKEVLQIPGNVDSAVISRFKVMAKMNIAEHRRPQDGNFTIKYKQCSYDFRVNTLPVAGKEKMVIRILAPASSLTAEKAEIKIDGMSPEQLQKVKDMTTSPNGIILTSGPTGSGKTTTLYSLIKALNDEKVNITTIEDPVEIKLEGINQSATNVKAGITFASCMRAILRQDPDIILVGEIRDFETLEVAISAALTGHLVLSTVHTNSAAATVTRLVEMGAKDYLVSSTLTGVLAQRLVRRICPHCKEEYSPSLEEAKKVLLDPKEIEAFTKKKIFRAKGCTECEEQGYKGRLGVYEVMPINKEIRKLIVQKVSEIEIEDYAVAQGMWTLQRACLAHIENGLTTIEEFIRVLGLATD